MARDSAVADFGRRDGKTTGGEHPSPRIVEHLARALHGHAELSRSGVNLQHELLASAAPIYAADRAGSLLFANPGYKTLLQGRKPGDDVKRIGDATPAGGTDLVTDDEPNVRLLSPEALVLVEREMGSVTLEHALEFDGMVRHYRSRHFPITDREGELVAVGGIYQDISRERAIAERAVHAQERFEDIARLVSDWMWEVDRDFNFTYVSSRVMEVFGMHPRLLLGTDIFELGVFTEGDGEPPDKSLRTPFRDYLFRVIGADGRARLCRLSGMPIFDTAGAFIGYRGTGTDITAQLEAEERASRAQSQLAAAIESSSEAFALFDRDNRLVICNTRYRDYLPKIADLMSPGVTYEELLIKGAERGQFADAAGDVDAWVARELDNLRDAQGAYEQQLNDGRWLKVSDQRMADGSLVCLRTDITELKQRENALRQAEESSRTARESAEIANRAKSDFLANVSHELRTPLNAIIGFSEIIMAEMFGPLEQEQYKEYIKDIHDSGTHLYSLINDILDVSKAEAGKLDLNEAVVDVSDTIDRCMRLVSDRATRAEVTLRRDIAANPPQLFVDERKLKQILLNLLSNAVKFTPPGGSVTTTAQVTADGWYEIAVVDTGIGIAEDDLATVMEAFGQVDSTLARKYEGTGLGLPLTKAMVELHDGILDLRSEIDHGTTVAIRFPKERIRA